MDIAIIGAGNVGRALAASMTRAGHHVSLAASHPERARQAAAETGATAAESSAQAVRGADVVVLAVPYGAVDAVAGEIAAEAAGKVLVDVTNPLTPDYSGLAVEGTSAAEEIQRRLPDATVVKAFNTLFASNQASPRKDLQALVASDDEAARQQVLDLAGSMGFSPLAVGALKAARTLEAMAFLNIGLNVANGWGWTSAWTLES
jgi:8-hydroxy-5-deazaflavin:NADPH oxidoreductase